MRTWTRGFSPSFVGTLDWRRTSSTVPALRGSPPVAWSGTTSRTAATSTALFPITRADAAARQPRLVGARELVDTGSVEIQEDSEDGVRALVGGRAGDYLVSIRGDEATCTCTWFAKHGRDRGPCRHVLALQMTLAR